jgi:hypothetical protein
VLAQSASIDAEFYWPFARYIRSNLDEYNPTVDKSGFNWMEENMAARRGAFSKEYRLLNARIRHLHDLAPPAVRERPFWVFRGVRDDARSPTTIHDCSVLSTSLDPVVALFFALGKAPGTASSSRYGLPYGDRLWIMSFQTYPALRALPKVLQAEVVARAHAAWRRAVDAAGVRGAPHPLSQAAAAELLRSGLPDVAASVRSALELLSTAPATSPKDFSNGHVPQLTGRGEWVRLAERLQRAPAAVTALEEHLTRAFGAVREALAAAVRAASHDAAAATALGDADVFERATQPLFELGAGVTAALDQMWEAIESYAWLQCIRVPPTVPAALISGMDAFADARTAHTLAADRAHERRSRDALPTSRHARHEEVLLHSGVELTRTAAMSSVPARVVGSESFAAGVLQDDGEGLPRDSLALRPRVWSFTIQVPVGTYDASPRPCFAPSDANANAPEMHSLEAQVQVERLARPPSPPRREWWRS